jgi:hypothetical protein
VNNCFETLQCAIGCGGAPVCFGDCLARACPSARALVFETLTCIADSGCDIDDISCLIGACPSLFSCLSHSC